MENELYTEYQVLLPAHKNYLWVVPWLFSEGVLYW